MMAKLFPLIWITGFGVGTLWLLVSPETIAWNGVRGGAPTFARWLMLAAWITGSALILLLSWGLKRVRLDDNHLLVSDYLRETAIPLSEILNIRQRVFPHPGSITIEFRSRTKFGRQVTFIPNALPPKWSAEEGPVLKELRGLVDRATIQFPNTREQS
jgi:hypothetical protein